ncbi:response regulator transcription factor [Paenibacillus sp. GSMTC-2017]|uniref:response regulator transcription factor n=1 Tax=Paenibacillus sp. GSMTC-2017 TaxID=2794350 RepID=UPI0018D934BB|nr:response regulator transcription factor [Paenibacillus sp. GSMTC-2017]MBH5320126.1 response regulator transcription factor [Paenibacillus sp. GSMTC-2017]
MNDAFILLVDDEQSILDMLETVLRKEGFTSILKVTTAEEALDACSDRRVDIIVLDVMLPGRSGIDAAPFLRQLTNAPILFLTARTSDFDKLTGFAVGGDDYITKPFNPLEVVARIRSQLRRYLVGTDVKRVEAVERRTPTIYNFGRFQVNEEAGELIVEGQSVTCPALVFQLLLFLCKNPNRIFGKSELYESVWGIDALNDDNTVMVHIHRIRERIEVDPSNPQFVVNVRGLGYKLIQKNTQGTANL